MHKRQFERAVHVSGGPFRLTPPSPKHPRNLGLSQLSEGLRLNPGLNLGPNNVSRRNFFGIAAGAATLVFAPRPSSAQTTLPGTFPKPIAGGISPLGPGTPVFHFNLPDPTSELSSITDFNGRIGVANLGGTGTGTNTRTGATSSLVYDVDVRFMQGEYIGTDGKNHFGTFGFI